MQKERSRIKNNPLPDTQVSARDFWRDRINEPIRPSIKVLLLIPLGFGISMIWQMITFESGAAQEQQSVDIGSTLMMGLIHTYILTLLIVLPLNLIIGRQFKFFQRPVLDYFFERWKYIVFSITGISLLDILGTLDSFNDILAQYTEEISPIVFTGFVLVLLIILSELAYWAGRVLFSLFSIARKGKEE